MISDERLVTILTVSLPSGLSPFLHCNATVFRAANYIHVSETTAEIIQATGSYELYSRGHLQLKVSNDC